MIMLAMYPEEQDLVLAEVKQYAREDGMPVRPYPWVVE